MRDKAFYKLTVTYDVPTLAHGPLKGDLVTSVLNQVVIILMISVGPSAYPGQVLVLVIIRGRPEADCQNGGKRVSSIVTMALFGVFETMWTATISPVFLINSQ